jgi:ubiquinone biosynthesis protein Coq4
MLKRGGGAAAPAARWTCAIGPLTLRLPNFAWRQRAIEAHDLHHLMTGYPMTMRGEFQLAAWEAGAGRYPHWGATMMCTPLILAGLFWSPRAIWRAWRAGRGSRSLYYELGAR